MPVFSTIQRSLRKIVPGVALSGGEIGDSAMGNFLNYTYAWHTRNPGLAESIYVQNPKIPNIPMYTKGQAAAKVAAMREAATMGGVNGNG